MFPRFIDLHLQEYSGNEDMAPTTVDGSGEEGLEEDGSTQPFRGTRRPNSIMVITACDRYLQQGCSCRISPPRTRYRPPLPAILSACRESRTATLDHYVTVLNRIYNVKAQAVAPRGDFINPMPLLSGWETTPYNPSQTGVFINPAVDIPVIPFNVKSRPAVGDMDHLIAIAAKEVPGVRKVVLQCYIAMEPYRFWQSARFEMWKRMGATGDWVPRRIIVTLRDLEELVLCMDGGKELRKMLPEEWRERTASIWERELLGIQDSWPGEWGGAMPRLRFVNSLQDL